MEHSLLVFGTPGLVILVIGTAFGLLAAQAYLRGITSIPLIVMGAGGIFLAFLLLAIMLIIWVVGGAMKARQAPPPE